MSIVFEVSESGHSVIEKAIKKFHPHLAECEAKIECLVASLTTGGEKVGGCAVKVHGYPCAAKVKINSLADRTEGKSDATITLDSEQWEDMGHDQQLALIDHELQHLDVMREDEKGAILTDDQHRPRLKLRKHDHQFGWFDVIAERHADASFEVKQAKHFFDTHGQGWFGTLPWNRAPESAADALADLAEKSGKPKTAPGDKPSKASRGAGVKREKKALADKISERIKNAGMDAGLLECDAVQFITGKADWKTATLQQLATWANKLDEIGDDVIVNCIKSGAVAT